jgi:hypothetical protein
MYITDERDAKNKLLIKHSFNRALGFGLTAEQRRLIDDGTPAEREVYVQGRRKNLLLNVAIVTMVFIEIFLIYRVHTPAPTQPAQEITTVKHETPTTTSLCVESKIKTKCYDLL